jgi:hypothetical protein
VQRQFRKRKILDESRVRRLEEIPGWRWSAVDSEEVRS